VGLELYRIPVGDKYILYRPLRRVAFVGNGAMARLVEEAAGGQAVPPAAREFLDGIGFLEPDPPPPSPRDAEFRPTTAVLLATNRCNLRCVYCYADGGAGTPREVPLELARMAIDYVHQNAVDLARGRFELNLHGGGEPTLAWQTLVAAVAYARAKQLPCRVSLVSNGVWSARQRAWIVDNVDRVTVSFDGARETQDRQRPLASGRGTFGTVLESIRTLDRAEIDYGVRMTALAPWRGSLARDVGFLCRETGCRSIQVEPAYNQQRGQYRAPSPDQGDDFVAGFMEAFEIAEGARRRLFYSGARPHVLTASFCSAPYGSLIVTPFGDLVSCYEVTDRQHPLAGTCTIGRIDESAVVLDGRRRATLLARMEDRLAGCRDCFCYRHCAGDCHVKAFYPGTEAAPGTSLRCRVNRQITAQILLWYIARAEDGVYRGKRHREPETDREAE
jgi:uncharacterized protein